MFSALVAGATTRCYRAQHWQAAGGAPGHGCMDGVLGGFAGSQGVLGLLEPLRSPRQPVTALAL